MAQCCIEQPVVFKLTSIELIYLVETSKSCDEQLIHIYNEGEKVQARMKHSSPDQDASNPASPPPKLSVDNISSSKSSHDFTLDFEQLSITESTSTENFASKVSNRRDIWTEWLRTERIGPLVVDFSEMARLTAAGVRSMSSSEEAPSPKGTKTKARKNLKPTAFNVHKSRPYLGLGKRKWACC